MASARDTSCIPLVENDDIAVGVLEEAHVADAGVERVAEELDAFRLEFSPRLGDVGDADSEAGLVRLELDPLLLGIPERERHVRGLDLGALVLALRDPEHVAVERDRALDVARGNRDEVDLLDVHGSRPSRYGA